MRSINYTGFAVKITPSFAREKQPSETVFFDLCKRFIANLSYRS